MVGVPLAVIAAETGMRLWALPVAVVVAWWYAPRDDGREWLMALAAGQLGALWASLGAAALIAWPQEPGTVGLVWAGSAAAIAVGAWMQRRTSSTSLIGTARRPGSGR